MYKIIQKRKIWLTFSSCLVVVAIVGLALWNLNFGIDFTGGSLMEVRFAQGSPAVNEIRDSLEELELSSLIIQPVGDNEMILRFQDVTEEVHQEILLNLSNLADNGGEEIATSVAEVGVEVAEVNGEFLEELKFDSVGPSIGQELKEKSVYAIILVLIAIVAYIAWAFRRVSKPIASWKYGITAIIALFHDVIIVLGVAAFLGKFYNMEVNAPFVAAVLTVLGYSVNDTIVVFDRVRENLLRTNNDFESTVNLSINQTLSRSIYTSVTTLLVLLSILFFGGSSIRDFVLALSIGVLVGTYSSIFLASPILVVWEKFTHNS